MKNLFLRTRYNLESNSSEISPEYANQVLDLDIYIPHGLTGAKDICIRIYSDSYKFIGSWSISLNPNKTYRKIYMDIARTKLWYRERLYKIYIYVNGKAVWLCKLKPENDFLKWSKGIMEPLANHPDEAFFIEKLCGEDWWNKILQAEYKKDLLENLIERLNVLDKNIKENKIKKVPHMLVIGQNEYSDAKFFTSTALGNFITDNGKHKMFCFSISETTNGTYGWKYIEKEMAASKVVAIEVPELEFNAHTMKIINIIANIIRYDSFRDTTFIMHGTLWNIFMIMHKCEHMMDLFTENNTFRISYCRSLEEIFDFNDENHLECLFIQHWKETRVKRKNVTGHSCYLTKDK